MGYLKELSKNLKRNGLIQPLQLCVSKLTGRAYLYEGNHRMAVFRQEKVEWIPVLVHYLFQNDDNDERYHTVPIGFPSNQNQWPSEPTPEMLGLK